jgi:hypothetical protein
MYNYFKVLQVEENASNEEIKKKYHLLAKEFHPDKNIDKDNEELFKLINEAMPMGYEIEIGEKFFPEMCSKRLCSRFSSKERFDFFFNLSIRYTIIFFEKPKEMI